MTTRRPWTRKEEQELARLCAAGLKDAAVGRRMGRSRSAVSFKRWKLGLAVTAKNYAHDATVRRLNKAGWFDWEIALEIDRHVSLVRHIRWRLGLPANDAARSRCGKGRAKREVA